MISMKNPAFNIFIALLILISAQACKKKHNREVRVFRNCTGTYVVQGADYYRVCNKSLLDSYSDGSRIIVDFKIIKQCDNFAICDLGFPYKDEVELTEVKNDN